MSGINLDSSPIDASFSVLYFIAASPVSLSFKNVEIDMVLESSSSDNVHWALAEDTKINFGITNITFTNSLLNEIVDYFNASSILNDLEPLMIDALDNAVANLN